MTSPTILTKITGARTTSGIFLSSSRKEERYCFPKDIFNKGHFDNFMLHIIINAQREKT
ncbi:unnamed protein product [Amoebophrya sp. A25]|nr:unnamed protein product [Amoebophrya sp. A25]|eukprot:GSA25T00011347001.1